MICLVSMTNHLVTPGYRFFLCSSSWCLVASSETNVQVVSTGPALYLLGHHLSPLSEFLSLFFVLHTSTVSDLSRGSYGVPLSLHLLQSAHSSFFILGRAVIYSHFLTPRFLSRPLFSVCDAYSLQVTEIASP